MSDRSLIVEWRDDTLTIGLNRPQKRNALNEAMVSQIHDALDDAVQRPCVVLFHSTSPGIFASGADLRELMERGANDALRRININLFDRIEHHRWPTIAAVDGPALGAGCELALACDLRSCSSRGSFGQPETSLGVMAGAGGNWRLPQLVGIANARRMLYLGRILQAREALEAGMVDELAEEPFDAALAMAAVIARRSWTALELTKLALGLNRRTTTEFDVVAQAFSFESDEKRDRIAAFLNRSQTEGSVADAQGGNHAHA